MWAITGLIVAATGLIVWIFKRHMEDDRQQFTDIKILLKERDDDDKEVPRALILERIENLHGTVMEVKSSNRKLWERLNQISHS